MLSNKAEYRKRSNVHGSCRKGSDSEKRLFTTKLDNRHYVGVINYFKVPFIKCFSTDFGPIVIDLPSVFHLTAIWSCKVAPKSEAVKSTL